MKKGKSTIDKKLRILIAEDSIDDYDLMVDRLTRSGLKFVSKRVETAPEFETSLKKEKWDLILSDNSLPSFNAKEALKITRQYSTNLPFIIVSGTIGEETAVEAMKAGANDYILKDNLSRLAPAIHRELIDYDERLKMKQTKIKLRKSQKYYKLLAQNVQDLVCVHDNTGEYSWVSPSSNKILWLTPDEMIAAGPYSLLHPEDKDRVEKEIKRILKGSVKDLQRYKYRMKRKDGVYIHLETLAEPIFEDGKLYNVVSTSRDITEQVLAFNLLQENELKYESVLECLSEGIILLDAKEKIVASNKSARRLLSQELYTSNTLSEVIFDNFELVNKDKNSQTLKDFFLSQTLKKGQPQFNKIYGFRSQKKTKWLSFNSVPYIIDSESQGVIVSFTDVTERYQYEDRLNRLATELVTLIENANAPIFGINKEGDITEWNSFSRDITGYSKSEALTKNLYEDLIIYEDRKKIHDLVTGIIENNVSASHELPIITKSGEIVTLLFNGSARRDYDNNIIGIVCVGQDITELTEYRQQLEHKVEERTRELKMALQKEKELVKLKSKFVSMASHEFRTPLSTIKFASDFIKKYHEKAEWSKLAQKLEKIDEQVNNMTYLLDDVLMMGKSDAGKIKVEKKPVALADFFEGIIGEVENLTNGSHKIEFSFSSTLKYVSIDEKLLRNIFINLLNNAVKFSPGEKRVAFELTCTNSLLSAVIQDWGLGIPESDKEKVYEAFHRSDSVATIQGTGLGLSIVKKAVELQNGTISHESELNKGTKFIIKIPMEYEEDSID